jgi:hypothetical protein
MRGAATAGELVLAPESVRPLTNVRSTIVSAGIAEIRNDGLFDAYLTAISPEHRSTLVDLTAGRWIPVDVAAAHYRAYDTLGFAPAEQVARGRRGTASIGRTIFGSAVQGAKSMGATPWTLFGQFPRFWARAYDGGALSIYKTGPKEAHIEIAECSLLEIPYFRRSLQGFTTGLLAMVCQTIYMHEVASTLGSHAARFRAQWV